MRKKSLTQRKSHIELPAGDEIMHISDAEEKRPPHLDKQNIHYPDFDTIRELYRRYSLDTTIFDNSDLTAQHILEVGGKLLDELVLMLLDKKPSKVEVQLFKRAYNYLSEEDKPVQSDYIFVFGARTPLRIQKAIDLYRKGLARKIIISGRGPFYGKTEGMTEAERYAGIALKQAVPQKALVIENGSITIPDNVRRTLNMMDAKDMGYKSFVLVNSPYTQRRGWCVWKKHTSDEVKLYRVNCNTRSSLSRDNWFKNEDGLRVVLGEFVKLRNTIAFNDA